MLQTDYHYSLNHHNTMALVCTAKTVITLNQETALNELPASKDYFILSGGSNVLLPEYLDATVLLPRFLGKKVIHEDDTSVILEVMAGENWHELVVSCTQKGWYGLENLALIPGLVGAAPVQNIGAYGVQLEDVLVSVNTYALDTGKWQTFSKDECAFAYRDSMFKREKNLMIVSVRLGLHKDPYRIHSSYGDLAERAVALASNQAPTALEIMQAVIVIRQQKLPDPSTLANAGSFFHNPIVSKALFATLQASYPTLPSYQVDETRVKLPAGWLIEQAGLKGQGVFPILTHAHQALVLTNHAPHKATQADIKKAQTLIVDTVYEKFGVQLMREPVWLNADGSILPS